MRAASAWEACPRCLARDKIAIPLTFELGWRAGEHGDRPPAIKRISLDRSPVEEPAAAEADAA